MDTDTQDEIILPAEMFGETRKYIVDNLHLDLLLLGGEPVAVDLPELVMMRVTERGTPVARLDQDQQSGRISLFRPAF